MNDEFFGEVAKKITSEDGDLDGEKLEEAIESDPEVGPEIA